MIEATGYCEDGRKIVLVAENVGGLMTEADKHACYRFNLTPSDDDICERGPNGWGFRCSQG